VPLRHMEKWRYKISCSSHLSPGMLWPGNCVGLSKSGCGYNPYPCKKWNPSHSTRNQSLCSDWFQAGWLGLTHLSKRKVCQIKDIVVWTFVTYRGQIFWTYEMRNICMYVNRVFWNLRKWRHWLNLGNRWKNEETK
jgi:hypothetical protein